MVAPGAATTDEWALDASFALLGRAFNVQTVSRTCADLILAIFGDCRLPPSNEGPTYQLELTLNSDPPASTLLRDGQPLLASGDPRSVVSLLTWHVMNDAVSETDRFFVVHAGSVVSPIGSAIVLPASSGSGKTTLTAALVRAGCSYLSDEMAAFDPKTGHVIPVPRALSIKLPSFDVLRLEKPSLSPDAIQLLDGAYPVSPSSLRPDSLGDAAPLGAVIAPSRTSDGTTLTPISRAEMLAELIRNAFNVESFGGGRALDLLGRVLRGAPCYRLAVGAVDDAVAAVLEVVASAPR